jgi:alpha,alpha-trehalase
MKANSLRVSFLLFISAFQQVFGQETEYQIFFRTVQMAGIFSDSKTFPDCTPKFPVSEILKKYKVESKKNNFDLRQFVLLHYELPKRYSSDFKTDTSRSPSEHINALWPVLTRQPEKPVPGSSLLRLPKSYVVPGGRFGEIYYWDSYFTMLGLEVSGRYDLIRNMIDNFAFLIDSVGFIPNGNRSYYLTRSQPPFFSMMVQLLAHQEGDKVFLQYQSQLEKEYNFWMDGNEKLSSRNPAYRRVVRMTDGEIMNRYWDDTNTPREESFKEDVLKSKQYKGKPEDFYRHIRAACESGWDFSSRWFRDGKSLSEIHTTEIVPVDLNSLLCNLEMVLAKAYSIQKDEVNAHKFSQLAENRKKAIFKYNWDKTGSFFTDYDFVARQLKKSYSLAGMFPFFLELGIGMPEPVAARIEKDFLKANGLITTLSPTGQQWDNPNGWSPLQWVSYQGLKTNGFDKLATEIKTRWINVNTKVYKHTGKMVEKYNVLEKNQEAGGGEYPLQDGFGWTNGVLLKMLSENSK